jgi:hypothetical protein
MVTLDGLKLQVGKLCALAGKAVKAQFRSTVPEYALSA